MTQANKIMSDALQRANNEQARAQMPAMTEAFKIIAEVRWQMYTAYIDAGFTPKRAMFLVVMDIEDMRE